MNRLLPVSIAASLLAAASAHAQLTITWYTIDGGGVNAVSAGNFTLGATIGQPDAGRISTGSLECIGGFWGGADAAAACYANCDGSTAAPVLTANDFQCFLNAFAAGCT